MKFFNFLLLIFDSVFRICLFPFPFPDSRFHVLVLPFLRKRKTMTYSFPRKADVNKCKLKTRLLLVSDVIRATVELGDSPELRRIQNLHLIMTAFPSFSFELFSLPLEKKQNCRSSYELNDLN